jgi:tRNA (cmo5U34)-methyltransferase
VGEEQLRRRLEGQFHFDPSTYEQEIRAEVPQFDRLQRVLASASGAGAARILELGTGTGETSALLLDRHPEALLVGIDSSENMLAVAREAFPRDRVDLRVARLEDELPPGPFDLVASALAVHHLDGPDKAELFSRVAGALRAGGLFVLADVVVPIDPADADVPLTPGYDKPSSVADQLRWLAAAGFDASVRWADGDLAVIVARS